jgi:hypothetical protein
MSASGDTTRDRPLAEPGAEQSGKDVGGMRASADGGLRDATQRSMERCDESPLGRASTGNASGGAADPRLDLGGTNAPGAAATPTGLADAPVADERAAPAPNVHSSGRGSVDASADDDEERWRHEPVAPVDEPDPLKSVGRAVADVVTGGSPDASKQRDR